MERRPISGRTKDVLVRLPESWYRGLFGILRAVERFDLSDRLGDVRCPTLVVIAGDDRIMPRERSEAVAEGIDGAETVIHPTSGHALVVEDPGWLAAIATGFLDRIDGRV